jgi:hypothetical protein
MRVWMTNNAIPERRFLGAPGPPMIRISYIMEYFYGAGFGKEGGCKAQKWRWKLTRRAARC